ncbi:hypothetical protein T09_1641 [Trichinella sp. T9]|nr:hypothetical protein T09_1641 [Trichinella sp. T9]
MDTLREYQQQACYISENHMYLRISCNIVNSKLLLTLAFIAYSFTNK